MNVINCKSPDGTMTLSACDSEVLKSDARMAIQPCKSCHAQMDLYSRDGAQLRPDRQLSDDGRSRPPDRSVGDLHRTRRSRPRWSQAPQPFAQVLAASGVIRGCAVQKVTSYAIGDMIRTYNTCELNDLRSQTNGTITSLFKTVAMASFLRARTGGTK